MCALCTYAREALASGYSSKSIHNRQTQFVSLTIVYFINGLSKLLLDDLLHFDPGCTGGLHAHRLESIEVLLREEHVQLAHHLAYLNVRPAILSEAIIHPLGCLQMDLRVNFRCLYT